MFADDGEGAEGRELLWRCDSLTRILVNWVHSWQLQYGKHVGLRQRLSNFASIGEWSGLRDLDLKNNDTEFYLDQFYRDEDINRH